MPARDAEHQLRAVLSYYYSVVNVTPEGDSIVSEELVQGLGTDGSFRSIVYTFFGSIIRVAFPFGQTKITPEPPLIRTRGTGQESLPEPADDMPAHNLVAPPRQQQATTSTHTQELDLDLDDGTPEDTITTGTTIAKKKYKLTDFVPDTGYFLAGAIAGGVSRTATAPLDRLKVFLLVNTSSGADSAISTVKTGRPVTAVKSAARPIGDAVRYLFQTGGVRGFFAGESARPLFDF